MSDTDVALAELLLRPAAPSRSRVVVLLLTSTGFAALFSTMPHRWNGQHLVAHEPVATLATSNLRHQGGFPSLVPRQTSQSPTRQSTRMALPSAASPRSVDRSSDTLETNAGRREALVAAATMLAWGAQPARARLPPNFFKAKPELLPKDFTTIIDVPDYLTKGQETRIKEIVAALEKGTGVKLRVLVQNFPTTPGLAVQDFWGVDDDTVVMVVDPGLKSRRLINFNVGENVAKIPPSYWLRVGEKFGTPEYFKENDIDAAIVRAVKAVNVCVLDPEGKSSPCQTLETALPEKFQVN
eukprot:gnl/TRDRNA2_/TRDRNA2_121409_c0_seq1.p1 gnl/TRDRNA2_/TRDRNA2_121409_c0~~gnl/TRDRNA2_/TRDRNA2_121409_c0_seq1.p1  ORF type:complete len:297 (+),score=26.80 gnl/TRDRNA2_/TRDRNA2_121409_c0_seq1:71-961(+)